MPSIRLTPLQPTTFDQWRDRVLTVPRHTLIEEAAEARTATDGSFASLTRRLVGDAEAPPLARQIQLLTDTLKTLLSDSRSGNPVGIGQTAADLTRAFAADAPLTVALGNSADALGTLAGHVDDPDGQDPEPVPSDAGIPDDHALVVLAALDRVRALILDPSVKNGSLYTALKNWAREESSGQAGEALAGLGDDWLSRFKALGDALVNDRPGSPLSAARRERLGEVIALAYDVSLALSEADDAGSTTA
ncbi:hypothetical protein [Roseateles terrae]|uniref:Uncharacterized protein n=1 Tax=Roseateles terrae TaxID=431060 RepID=A0ABR6GR58_9BURK|nr:hypothetical protein [Roseateles terrae]MBB3193648.1 hypothetical protein [Roseateles terrae]OWQ89191.1 hypothetical protein CDN98_01155 [Roseateles terrae]